MRREATAVRRGMQSAIGLLFPPQCVNCKAPVASDFGLCADCWQATPFVTGLVCDQCGTPLPGTDTGGAEYCDDCLTIARPWQRGRAGMLYRDVGRKLVLALKHGDRLDLARPAAKWLARAAVPLLCDRMLVAPVPLHWQRLLRRRYNQSALLSRGVAMECGLDHCPDLLVRRKRTATQDGLGRDARFANLAGSIQVHPARRQRIAARHVLLVDDVMTSGATLAAAADCCLGAGAESVSVLVLARVAKDD
ncbi:MAG: ComF family protein [Rhodobacteraceae bacterium]|nr:ComF family protein [Paracoccaceae bacterium]